MCEKASSRRLFSGWTAALAVTVDKVPMRETNPWRHTSPKPFQSIIQEPLMRAIGNVSRTFPRQLVEIFVKAVANLERGFRCFGP
jgi:hypothetical protein